MREVTNKYYSGQGRLLIGKRNAVTGEGYGLVPVGNTTAVSVEIAVEKFEHNESSSGNRALDLSIVKKQTATIKFTGESLSLENLAMGLFGKTTDVVGATVAGEVHTLTGNADMIPLKFPNVSGVTIKVGAAVGSAVAVTNTNGTNDKFEIDPQFGTIYIRDKTAFPASSKVFVDYTYAALKRLDVFTNPVAEERFVRFEGINTVNGELVLLNIPRVTLDPIAGYQLITEELANAEFTGNILLDPTISAASGSQFMTQYNITPA